MALTTEELNDAASGITPDLDSFDESKADYGESTDETPVETPVEAHADTVEDETSDTEKSDERNKSDDTDPGELRAEDKQNEDTGEEAYEGEVGEVKAEPKIPKSRFDKTLARMHKAEEELAKLRQKQEAPKTEEAPQFDERLATIENRFAEIDAEITEAFQDGDSKKFAELKAEERRLTVEARKLENEAMRYEMQRAQSTTIDAARELAVVDDLIEELVENNTVFQQDHPDFNQALVNEIEDLRDFYESRGYSASQALVKAVQVRAPQAIEKQAPAKRKTDTKRAVAAANAQPPSLSGVGEDSPAAGKTRELTDITKITNPNDPRLDNLSKEQWDELLGNYG